MLKKIHGILGAVLLLSANQAFAGVSPLSVAILSPVQFPGSDFTITGARASVFWGRHRSVYGFDFSVVGNYTEQNFLGTAVSGIFNSTNNMTTIIGAQIAGAANINTGKIGLYGLQLALINSNMGEGSGVGFQLGLGNISPHMSIAGVQAGVYNRARAIYGFQIGLFNSVDDLHGIQIGLVNYNKSGPFSVSPLINVGF